MDQSDVVLRAGFQNCCVSATSSRDFAQVITFRNCVLEMRVIGYSLTTATIKLIELGNPLKCHNVIGASQTYPLQP